MTTDDRFDSATVDLVAKALCLNAGWPETDWDDLSQPGETWCEPWRREARAALTALADAGLLLPAGAEVRNEWKVEIDKGQGWQPSPTPYITTDRQPEPSYVGDIDAYMRGIRYPKRKVRRTVHTGPWQPVDTEETGR